MRCIPDDPTVLELEAVHGKNRYRVAQAWMVMSFIVPMGFVTDGASIPKFFWFFIGSPFDPQFAEAAVLHDWMYSSSSNHALNRLATDIVFKQMLLKAGVPKWKARLMYFAVACFGWMFWKKKR